MTATPQTAAPCVPGLDEARRFLELLDPLATSFTFQTFNDRKERNGPNLTRILNGPLDDHAAELTRLNRAGAGVFVTVNKTDGRGRKAENIVGIRAVWHEDDSGSPIAFRCRPSIEVESSCGKYHRYWLVDGMTAEEHRGVMELMDVIYGSDSNAKDVSRVLRLPGFAHMKGVPFQTVIVRADARAKRYTRDEILKEFPPIYPDAMTAKPDTAPAIADDREPRRDAYALAALRNEALALSEEGAGGRNHALNRAAVKLGSLIPHRLSRAEVEEALLDACEANGLASEGKAGVRATIKSGIEHGIATPRFDGLPSSSSAETDFANIALTTVMPDGSSVLEFPSEISLDAIIARESGALVKGLLHPGVTAMLYGASGTGKSFLALDLAWHIATGREWHGRRVTQASALYVCLEGVDGFRKRELTYLGEYGDPGKHFARHVVHVSLAKTEVGEKGASDVIAAAKKLSVESGLPTRLIVIDTLARAMAGDDENATGEMTAFVELRAGYIARTTGAAVLIIHHTNAAGTVRGNTSLWAACETVLRANPGDKHLRMLASEKVKDGKEGPLFNYTFEVVPLGTDADGDPITSCIVRSTPIDLAPDARPRPPKIPKHMKVFAKAFEAALAARHFIEVPSAEFEGLDLTISKVDLAETHKEFDLGYVTGAADAKTVRETKARQWRLALDSLGAEFETGVVDGIERVWRRQNQFSIQGGG